MIKDTAASVRQKLKNLARTREEDFDYVLRQYVMQRLLYRLGVSNYVEQFLLKGALLFWVWNKDFHRPTRDIDLLTYTDNDVGHLLGVFQQIITTPADDGLVFDADSLNGFEIKEDADYKGVRITGFATLTNARVPFQIDIGYGDVIVPAAEEAQIPAFLGLPAPKLKIYPVYSVIAEKFQAMIMLGQANSRMKDFYDISDIAHTMPIDGSLLSQALKATFERRKTEFSKQPLYVFSTDFTQDKGKNIQWNAFLNKNSLKRETGFPQVVGEIQQLLEPVYESISDQQTFDLQWSSEDFQWKG